MAEERGNGDAGAADAAAPPGLAGGLADKLGNRYEGRWTIGCLGVLLKDEWEHIDLEPYDGVKVEFHARRRDGIVEHHQEQTKREPNRFVRLGIGLEDDLAIVYGEQILLGVREADDPSAELVFDLVRRLHRLPGRPCGRFLADAVAKFASAGPLPDDIVDIVAWYAVSSPDPAPGYSREAHERNDPMRLGLIDVGINTVRGDTAHAIARILQSDVQPFEGWRDVIAAMVLDDSDGVRSCVAGVLLVCLDRDRDWVIDRALELFDGRDDVATERGCRATHPLRRSHSSGSTETAATHARRAPTRATASSSDATSLATTGRSRGSQIQ